jgi:hypothetical protein
MDIYKEIIHLHAYLRKVHIPRSPKHNILVEILPSVLIHFVRLLSLLHTRKCFCFHLLTPACELRATNWRTRDSVRLISCSGTGRRIHTDRLLFLIPSLPVLPLFRSYGWIVHSTALGQRRQQADIMLLLPPAACENISAGSTVVIQLSQDSSGAIQLPLHEKHGATCRTCHHFM